MQLVAIFGSNIYKYYMDKNTQVSIIMGSKSDWPTMNPAAEILTEFDIEFEMEIVSAHRTPDRMFQYAKDAEKSNLQAIIAGAGGAAHLPGMVASLVTIPVIGVPVESKALKGMDSLLSIVQMPASTPVATMAIGVAGAKNAAWLALRTIGLSNPKLRDRLRTAKADLAKEILECSES